MKSLVRVLAFDDGAFVPKKSKSALLVGVLSRLDNRVEGILSRKIRVDGWNATQQIIAMIKETRFGVQARFLLLSGLNFAGFNIVNISLLFQQTHKPILVVFRKKPCFSGIKHALQFLSSPTKRWQFFQKAGPVFSANGFYFQCKGFSFVEAKTILEKLCQHSNLPEPIRLAHLIASGVSRGESARQK